MSSQGETKEKHMKLSSAQRRALHVLAAGSTHDIRTNTAMSLIRQGLVDSFHHLKYGGCCQVVGSVRYYFITPEGQKVLAELREDHDAETTNNKR